MRNKKAWKYVIIGIIGIMVVCNVQTGLTDLKTVAAAGNAGTGKVIDAEKNYLEPGKNNRMMIMELGATTCIPCKMMTPILEELAKEQKGKLDVQFVDVYKRGDLAQKFKIFSIPTQIIFDTTGKEVFRHIGFYPKAEIMKKLKEFGLK